MNCEQLVSVLQEIHGKLCHATVLFMQNVKPSDLELIPRYIGTNTYLLGFPFIAGGEREDNVINCAIYKKPIFQTMLGEPNGKNSKRFIIFGQWALL